MDELQTYLELKRQMREDSDARLKSAGMTWYQFIELEKRVIGAIPVEGVVVGKYRIVVEEEPTRIIPASAAFGPPRRMVKVHDETNGGRNGK